MSKTLKKRITKKKQFIKKQKKTYKIKKWKGGMNDTINNMNKKSIVNKKPIVNDTRLTKMTDLKINELYDITFIDIDDDIKAAEDLNNTYGNPYRCIEMKNFQDIDYSDVDDSDDSDEENSEDEFEEDENDVNNVQNNNNLIGGRFSDNEDFEKLKATNPIFAVLKNENTGAEIYIFSKSFSILNNNKKYRIYFITGIDKMNKKNKTDWYVHSQSPQIITKKIGPNFKEELRLEYQDYIGLDIKKYNDRKLLEVSMVSRKSSKKLPLDTERYIQTFFLNKSKLN